MADILAYRWSGLSRPRRRNDPIRLRGLRARRTVHDVMRIVVASAMLALVGAVVPWDGSAGAAVAPAPGHRADAMPVDVKAGR